MRTIIPRVCVLTWFLAVGCSCAFGAQDSLGFPQKKSILLEEYTGFGCGNCPDGARMASVLKDIAVGRFHIISIHEGHYAEPIAGSPDYRTDFGQALLDAAGDIGYPCGSINRYPYVGNTLNMFRNEWTKVSKQVLTEDAAVNLSLQAQVDAQSRRLQVEVQYCFTQEQTDEFVLLNVALLQNHIVGYQNGGGSQYDHNHMLRHLLTGQWGDTLRQFTKGEIFTKQYNYDLPDSIRSVFVDIRNLELVAFITRKGGADVMNVTAANPRIDNLQEEPQVSIKAGDLPSSRYAYDFVDVQVRNLYSDTLKTLLFSANLNGKEQRVNVAAQIPPYQTQTICVRLNDFLLENNNTLLLRLTSVNEKEIETEEVKYSFLAPITITGAALYIELSTDLWGDEVSCSVKNLHGETVWSKGPFKAGEQTVLYDTVVLEQDGLYAIEFNDYWHDGWLVSPKGSFKVRASDGTMLGQNYSVLDAGDIIFFELKEGEPPAANQKFGTDRDLEVRVVANGFEILNPNAIDITGVEVFSTNGACVYRQSLHTNTNATVGFNPAATQMWIVGIKTAVGVKYKKLIK